jgi:serine/threonine-protein phosphatase PP1 catalytic subunit
MKIRFPTAVYLIRGNHETKDISRMYGFYTECISHYNQQLWNEFTEVFEYLPLAAIIDDAIFCVHGGLSPELKTLDQISSQKRPLTIPDSGFLADLLWSDPSSEHSGWKSNKERGTSYTFGLDVVEKFVKENNFDLLCRAHQVVNKGYDFPFVPNDLLITIFSAPDYCDEFRNQGAIMLVSTELECSFQRLDPPRKRANRASSVKNPNTPTTTLFSPSDV